VTAAHGGSGFHTRPASPFSVLPRLNVGLLRQITRLSTSATVQMLIGTASWIGLARIISTFGSEALAGCTIGIRVIVFALLPSWGLCNAASTMVGQALGAKKPDRAEASVWKAGFYDLCFPGAIGLAFVLFATPSCGCLRPIPR
jgi:Na+-driven multidrug efflux pump